MIGKKVDVSPYFQKVALVRPALSVSDLLCVRICILNVALEYVPGISHYV